MESYGNAAVVIRLCAIKKARMTCLMYAMTAGKTSEFLDINILLALLVRGRWNILDKTRWRDETI
jgi:hypothetical protein